MARWTLADLTTQLKRILTAAFRSARAFIGLKRQERLAETDLTARLKLDQGQLPESYGRTRLVMLVVDPYIVHAYWEVTPNQLDQAKKQIGAVRNTVQPVLRFYDVVDENWFDIPIGLEAHNWFVNLWSGDKMYYVDLGLKNDTDRFVSLVRSNLIHTPRTSPVVRREPHYTQVGSTGRDRETEAAERYLEFVRPPAHSKPTATRRSTVSAFSVSAEAPTAAGAPATLRQKLSEFHALREATNEELGVFLPVPAEPPETKAAKQMLAAPERPSPSEQLPGEPKSVTFPEMPLQPVDFTGVTEKKFQTGLSSTFVHVGHLDNASSH